MVQFKSESDSEALAESFTFPSKAYTAAHLLPGFLYSRRVEADGRAFFTFVSDGVENLLGLSPEDACRDHELVRARYHPADKPTLMARAQICLELRTPLCHEFRVLHPRHGTRWVELRSVSERLPDGAFEEHGVVLDITSRKFAEQKWGEAHALSNGVIQALPDLLFELDHNGCYLNVWAQRSELLAQPKESLLRRRVQDILSPESASTQMEAIREAELQGFSFGKVIRIDLSEGSRWFELSVSKKPGLPGEEPRFLVVSRDITERENTRFELERSEREFRSIMDNIPINIVRWDAAGCYLYINAHHERTLGKTLSEVLGTCIPESHDHVRAAIERAAVEGESSLTVQTLCDENGEKHFHEVGVYPERDGKGHIVSVLGIGRDVTELFRTHAIIAEHEQELQELLESIPARIVCYDLNGRIRYLNQALRSDLGIDNSAEGIGKRPAEACPDGRFDAIEHAVAEVAASGQKKTIEFCFTSPDGTCRTHEIRIAPKRNLQGKIDGTIAVDRDITKYKRVLHDLELREREFRSLAENLPDTVIRYDRAGRLVYVNTLMAEFFCMDKGTLYGRTTRELWPDGRYAEIEAALGRILDGTSIFELCSNEFWDECDQIKCYGEVKLVPEHDNAGNVKGAIALGRDLTALRMAENTARRLEHEFRSLAENMPDCLIRYAVDGGITYVNPVFERIFSKKLDDVAGLKPSVLGPEDDFRRLEAKILSVTANGISDEMDLAHRLANGEIRYTHIHIVAERNATGGITGVLTVGRDISERKRMEETMDRERATLRAYFQALPALAWMKDAEGRYLACNPLFESFFGCDEAYIVGKTDHDFFDAELAAFFREKDAAAMAADKPSVNEEWVTFASNGRHVLLETVKTPVYNARKELIGVLGIAHDITERNKMEEAIKLHELHLEHMAYHDVLTGLPNRIQFADHLLQGIAHARQSKLRLAVVYMDLDNFKPINDVHGHDMGDFILREIAGRLSRALSAGDTVARIGGDEFALILNGVDGIPDIHRHIEQVLKAITDPISVDNFRFVISSSMGISLFPYDGEEPDKLLRNADHAMYIAKRSGRNQHVFFGHELSERDAAHGPQIHELKQALQQGQIEVHYQPIVDLATGRVRKAEALARWTHPERGPISPAEFVPLAEDGGLIHELGDCVFQHTVRVAGEWNRLCGSQHNNGMPYRIAINRSPRQFIQGNNIDDWVDILHGAQACGDMISVEITEGLLLENRPEILEQLNRMRQMGMTISLDDFGTGYSALSYLKKFPIDILKIDRSFVSDIDTDESNRAIVESIIAMARRLGIKLVAEGVETEQQAKILKEAGCDMAQGYYFARPLPESEFIDFVLKCEK